MAMIEFNAQSGDAPAVLSAGNEAFGLWVRCVMWASKFEIVWAPVEWFRENGDDDGSLVARLVAAGLLRPVDGGKYVLENPAVADDRPFWRIPPRRDFIPSELRQAVYERDGFACVECGATEPLTLDHHPIPWSRGGPDTYENLRTLCLSCNSSKGARV